MDVALLLILPLVGGYYFANWARFSRYRSSREEGHRLYFRAAFYATFLFVAAIVLRVLLLEWEWYRHREADVSIWVLALVKEPGKGHQFPLAVVSFYAMLLGPIGAWIINRFMSEKYWLERAVKFNDFERVVLSATERRLPICVTMGNNKVYVGFVVTTVDPTRDRKSLGILPIVSGYRSATGKITFTTDYSVIYGKAPHPDARLAKPLQHLRPADFEIALPADRVQSCNIFDFRAYEEFTSQERPETPRRGPWSRRRKVKRWAQG